MLFEPTARSSVADFTRTKHYLILDILDNVKSRLVYWKYDDSTTTNSSSQDSASGAAVGGVERKGKWVYIAGEEEAVVRGVSITALDDDKSDYYWLTISSFLQVHLHTYIYLHLPCYNTNNIFLHMYRIYDVYTCLYMQPSTLSLVNSITTIKGVQTAEPIKQLPSQFNATDLVETQVLYTIMSIFTYICMHI